MFPHRNIHYKHSTERKQKSTYPQCLPHDEQFHEYPYLLCKNISIKRAIPTISEALPVWFRAYTVLSAWQARSFNSCADHTVWTVLSLTDDGADMKDHACGHTAQHGRAVIDPQSDSRAHTSHRSLWPWWPHRVLRCVQTFAHLCHKVIAGSFMVMFSFSVKQLLMSFAYFQWNC